MHLAVFLKLAFYVRGLCNADLQIINFDRVSGHINHIGLVDGHFQDAVVILCIKSMHGGEAGRVAPGAEHLDCAVDGAVAKSVGAHGADIDSASAVDGYSFAQFTITIIIYKSLRVPSLG